MAEDLHKEGSEEEKKQNTGAQDDDDFGLPDLEFEELEELDLDLEEESPEDAQNIGEDFNLDAESTEEKETSPTGAGDASALEEGIDEVEDVLDSAQLISDRLGDIEETPDQDFSSDINYDELLGDPAAEKSSDDPKEKEEDLSELDSIDLDSEDSYESKEDTSLSDINSPDELAALGIADEDEVMADMEDESGDSLFTSDGDSSSDDSDVFGGEGEFDGGSIFASDDISLEKEEEKEEEFEPEEALPPTYKPYSDDDDKGGFAKVIIFGAIGFALVGFIFYYFFTQDVGNTDGAKQPEHVAATKKPTTSAAQTTGSGDAKSAENGGTKAAASSSESTKEPGNATSSTSSGGNKSTTTGSSKTTKQPKPAKSAPAGEIVEIQDRTGRSYVIIGSFIDQDLANDYAKELSAAGSGVKIIFPYGTSKRYRVSVADFDSYSDAVAQLGNYKPTYGEDIWTLKY
ncbi:MAG: SPOR domain-containing protein [Cyclobacteriaceae bacterium]